MADALVSMAWEKLSNVVPEQLALFAGAADELGRLKSTFESIQALLVDAESRQVAEESVRLWLSRLRAVSYDIDDVLDEWAIISSGGEDDVDDGDDDSSSGRTWIRSKTLSKFVVGDEGGCEIDELQPLNSLQGHLEIESLERVSSRGEAERAELWKKPHLRSLSLSMSASHGDADAEKERERMESVFEGLQPHGNLEELQLDGYPSSNLPSWMEIEDGGSERLPDGGWVGLPALRRLQIWKCEGLKRLPDGLTRLQSLQSLRIGYNDHLQSLPEALGQLKELKSLQIVGLTALMYLPDSIGRLKSLEFLEIDHCKALASLPHGLHQLSLLRRFWMHNCPLLSERCRREGVDWPKISHIPSIIVDSRSIK